MIFLKQTKKEQRVLVSSSPHAHAKTFPFVFDLYLTRSTISDYGILLRKKKAESFFRKIRGVRAASQKGTEQAAVLSHTTTSIVIDIHDESQLGRDFLFNHHACTIC